MSDSTANPLIDRIEVPGRPVTIGSPGMNAIYTGWTVRLTDQLDPTENGLWCVGIASDGYTWQRIPEPDYAARARAWNADAEKLITRIRDYEDQHPDDALCLQPLLNAWPLYNPCPWFHQSNGESCIHRAGHPGDHEIFIYEGKHRR